MQKDLLIQFLGLTVLCASVICNEQQPQQNLQVNVPNFMKFLPDFNELLKDFRPGSADASHERLPQRIDNVLSTHLNRVHENYKRIGSVVESALNLDKLRQYPSLFSMSLSPAGQKTKMNLESPLAKLSLNSPTDPSAETEVTSTEVPFTEYLENLVQSQTEKSTTVHDQENSIFTKRMGYMPSESDDSDEETDSDESLEIQPQTQTAYEEVITDEDPYSYYVNVDPTSNIYHVEPQSSDEATSYVGSNYVMDVLSRPHTQSFFEQEEFSGDENIEHVVNRYKIGEYIPEHAEESEEHVEFKYGDSNLEEESDEDDTTESGRVVDQRDVEVAFLNVDEEESLKLDKSKRVVLAFTLTGVPVKIYIDRYLENPVQHLQNALSEVGVTMNIPVHSSSVMEPAGSDILYVGAGGRGSVTPTVALIVQDISHLKENLERFLEPRLESQVGQECQSKILTVALRKSLTEGSSFTKELQQAYEKNPQLVMTDIANFLKHSHETNLLDELLTAEAENLNL